MEFTVQQIAEVLGGSVEGEATRRVTGLAKIEEAQAGTLAFLANPKYEHFLYTTQASAVIVGLDLALRQPVAAALIRVADPYSGFTQLLEFYAQATRMGKRGVEQPAYLADSATIGAGHYRGAFSYIGDNCRLGDNVLVFPHAYIGDRVTIGEGSVIHAGAKIYSDTVIGRFCVIKAGAVVGTAALGGDVEAPATDGKGHIFVNIEDKSEVIEFDAKTLAVLKRHSVAPGQEPTGLAYDPKTNRLFSGCANEKLVVTDSKTGKQIAVLPTGKGTDGAAFDPSTNNVIVSNGGSGTFTIIHEDTPDKYTVVANLPTARGARTIAIDPKSHHLFTCTAEYGPAPAPTTENPHPRPSVVPGTFRVLEFGR